MPRPSESPKGEFPRFPLEFQFDEQGLGGKTHPLFVGGCSATYNESSRRTLQSTIYRFQQLLRWL
jgi:hypothetical protein